VTGLPFVVAEHDPDIVVRAGGRGRTGVASQHLAVPLGRLVCRTARRGWVDPVALAVEGVGGQLDDGLLPERAGRAQRVGRVGDQPPIPAAVPSTPWIYR